MLLIVDGAPFFVVPQSLPQEHPTDVAPTGWSVPEQLDTIKSQLDISVTQLAELFSVTRKTVYDWYEGQSPRNAKSAQINALIEVLGKRSDIDLKRLKGFWNVSLPGGSFRSTLQSDILSGLELTAALTAKLNELSAEMSATNRVPRQGATPYTSESTLADIEHRSDSY
jgi:predicted transcriptional regulator